ncbi:DUF6879 family protein [Streptomyces sp. NPDC088261]|uniref:DUF6879 family protein n=1 Tax=Streptomyces sp. NPDC088261 TaxID=3365851 RepID=UPI003812D1EB
MSDPYVPRLPPELGEKLVRDDYRGDFKDRSTDIRNGCSWKLERLQHFEEIGDPGRDALRRGDWDEALRLVEGQREDFLTAIRAHTDRGHVFRRVRVVAQPLTPYVQWELHSLRLQAECGRPVRVVSTEAVAAAETAGLLPEVVTLGGRTLYRILYTDSGRPDGAIRYTDPETVRRWERYIADLYDSGEDIAAYFAREIADLPAPKTPSTPPPRPE